MAQASSPPARSDRLRFAADSGTAQERDDLVEAIRKLRLGIQNLNKEARERLLASFEVVNNQLKLKSGLSLDHEGEPAVNVTVTATDGAGHQIQQTVTVTVLP